MTYSDEELLKIDPELDQLFKKRGIPKLPVPTAKTVPLLRKGYAKTLARFNTSDFAQAALGIVGGAKPTWLEEDRSIPMRDGAEVTIRIYTPNDLPRDGAPVALVIHAGGWFMGDLETDQFICQVFAAKLGMVVVNLDYRYYPENQFPIPIYDTYDAVKWISANAKSFGGNLQKGFLAGGTSGGSTFAAIAAHLANEDHLSPNLTGLFLFCPILDHRRPKADGSFTDLYPGRVKSHEQNAEAPLMTQAMREAIRTLVDYDFGSPLLSPFLFPNQKNMPATYVIACGLDPWRDGAIVFGEEVQKAGGKAKFDVYPGLPHCWWTTFFQLSANKRWLANTLEGMRWLLDQSQTSSAKL